MATIKTGDIIDRAVTVLTDAGNTRWSRAELLGWINDGQREVVLHKPPANTKNVSVLLTAGVTKQSAPSDCVSIFNVSRNMGANGTTPGQAIRIVSRDTLDALRPTWHTDAATGLISNYVFDPADPKTFYVYPKAPATSWYVELVYSANPTDCQAEASAPYTYTIQIDDVYANALLDYVLYRANIKDSEYAQNAQLAVAHYQAFANGIGIKLQNDLTHNPNLKAGPFSPQVMGGAVQ